MNSLTTAGYSNTCIKLKSNSGVKLCTINDYINAITSNTTTTSTTTDNDSISIVLSLAEEIPLLLDLPSKRIHKANERNKIWFNELKNASSINWDRVQLFGIAIPAPPYHKATYDNINDKENDHIKRIITSCETLIGSGVKGIVIGGAFQGETIDYLCRVISSVRKAIDDMNLPTYMPIMIQGTTTTTTITTITTRLL